METIHIAVTIDQGYVQHAGVMLCSLFENNLSNTFEIYLIVDFSHHKDLDKICKLINSYRHKLHIIQVEAEKVSSFVLSHHATKAVYYRLMLPDLLPAPLKKVLYLDSDIIFKSDIWTLWNTPIDQHYLAAVVNPLFNRHQQLGIPRDALYFNSGVMLLNLAKWRSKEITSKLLCFIENNPDKIVFWDQDALNAILVNEWLELHPRWNQTTPLFTKKTEELDIKRDWVLECQNTPTVIHFTGRHKPWDYYCDHPLKEEYFYYLAKTDWKGFKFQEEGNWYKIKKIVKRLLPMNT